MSREVVVPELSARLAENSAVLIEVDDSSGSAAGSHGSMSFPRGCRHQIGVVRKFLDDAKGH